MSTKPTPGPWFVGAQNDALYIIDRRPAHDNDYPDYNADRECIARVYDDVRGNEDAGRANARLIAAAPELLGIVQMVANLGENRELVERMADVLRPHERAAFVKLYREDASAAIAKATGEKV